MGKKRGPIPHSAEIIDLHGNPAHLSKAEIEERREREIPAERVRKIDPPDDLRGHARQCWKDLAFELDRLGLLTRLDLGTLRLACETYGLALEALEEMRPRKADGSPDGRRAGHELVIDGTRGQRMKHPGFAVYNMLANTYRGYCLELGLSPSARASLRPGSTGKPDPVGADAEDDDDFDFGT